MTEAEMESTGPLDSVRSKEVLNASSVLRRRWPYWLLSLIFCFQAGCAALRPLDGLPARYMPETLRGPSRSGRKTIDLSLLSQRRPIEHRVDSGDVLGIYIEGVLGRRDDVPPVFFPDNSSAPPSLGFPIPIRAGGLISLPLLEKPLAVRGMTLNEVERAIQHAYTVEQKLLNPESLRVLVDLQKPRQYRVLVIRQEGGEGAQGDVSMSISNHKRGTGQVVSLAAYENDVMHALTATNGLPGLDAQNTLYIIRGRREASESREDARGSGPQMGNTAGRRNLSLAGGHSVSRLQTGSFQNSSRGLRIAWGHSQPRGTEFGRPQVNSIEQANGVFDVDVPDLDGMTVENQRISRIPIRLGLGENPRIDEEDIILGDGDILFIESRETEIFYTGGLLGGGQYMLPRDYDLDVLGAIAIAQGANMNGGGGVGGSVNMSTGGVSALNQDVTVGASKLIVLRSLPNGTQVSIKVDLYKALRNPAERMIVQPGDYLVLQYTPIEAVGAWLERYVLGSAIFGLAAGQISN